MTGGTNPDARAAFGAPNSRQRGSTGGYWLAGLLALLAVGGAVAWFVAGFSGLSDDVRDLEQVPVPGQGVIELDAGPQSVYFEPSQGRVPPLRIALRRVGGPPVEVGPHGGKVTYSVAGRRGRSVAGFEVEEAGSYRLAVTAERAVPAGAILAVGPGVGGRIAGAVAGGIAIFFGGLLLAGATIIVTARRRRV